MKKSWSIPILMVVLAPVFGASAWAAELKIGVIEPQKILEETQSGKKIKDSLSEYVVARQRLLDSEAEDIKKGEDDLLKQSAGLNNEARQEKEDALRRKIAGYQRRVQELEGEVQAKKAEVLGEFTRKIEQVVREIAEKEKISLVMDKGGSDYGSLVLFNQPSVDLTGRVIKELDGRTGN